MTVELVAGLYSFPVFALQATSTDEGTIVTLQPFFGGNPWLNTIVPIVALAAVTIAMHLLLGGTRKWSENDKGLWVLIVGKDRRLSTSKVQLTLWTFAIVLALLLLLFFGKNFTVLELPPEYLLLLGSPAAAALLAKSITSTQVTNGTTENTQAEQPALKDVVTDEDGKTDLFDFQYFLFNLVLLVWFAVEMFRTLSDPTRLSDDAYFLPPLPLSLVGLTSVSAAGYVVKKGLDTEPPVLSAAFPSAAAHFDEVVITGRNLKLTSGRPLGSDPNAPVADVVSLVRVTIGGRIATVTSPLNTNAQGIDEIKVTVPADTTSGSAPIQFTRADGAKNEPTLGFEVVVGGPKISSVNPDRVVLGANRQPITIFGLDFGEIDKVAIGVLQNRIILGGFPLVFEPDNWTEGKIVASVPTAAEAGGYALATPDKHELVVIDRHGRRSAPPATVEVAP